MKTQTTIKDNQGNTITIVPCGEDLIFKNGNYQVVAPLKTWKDVIDMYTRNNEQEMLDRIFGKDKA